MSKLTDYDVIIIGGSYAGLSAAMALGRSLRNTLIIDGGSPCNKQTPNSHNFLTHDGDEPNAIIEKAKTEVLAYKTVQYEKDFVIAGEKIQGGFKVGTQTGSEYISRKLIFATGVRDIIPQIKGFKECWGISAIHCPYCHGYEYKSKKTGIMANGDTAFHMASLISNLTNDLILFTNGKADFNSDQLTKLKMNSIEIIEREISALQHEEGYIKNVVFNDGEHLSISALYAALPFVQHTDIPESFGCNMTDAGYVMVDDFQKTSIEGVFACGDTTTRMRSLATSVASGNLAGAMANMSLVQDEF